MHRKTMQMHRNFVQMHRKSVQDHFLEGTKKGGIKCPPFAF